MSLKLELAVTFDVGEHFDKATHFLVGLVPFLACQVKLSAVSNFIKLLVSLKSVQLQL